MVVVALSLGAMREATSLLSAAGELRYGTESLFCFALKLGAAFSFFFDASHSHIFHCSTMCVHVCYIVNDSPRACASCKLDREILQQGTTLSMDVYHMTLS